mmetsp:Transcript_28428/g.27394  ORF Transcript_28428/g.27394 Transcript_28428/m.27394 type:complete len:281 (-) Transcript_28428:88-930(-)
MLLNIFPEGNSCLHLLCTNDQPDDVQELFKLSQPNVSKLHLISYHMPIIKNFANQSPLDAAKEKHDYKSIDVMLKYLKAYPLDHHSKEVVNIIPHLIEKGIPELPGYLEKRMLQTEHLKTVLKAKLKDDYPEIVPVWLWQSEFNEDSKNNRFIDQEAIEKRIKCEIIDLPIVYHYQDQSFQEYFDALANTDNYDYFSIRAVQKLIEVNYPLVIEFTIKTLFIPYVIFLILFVIYFNGFMEDYLDMREYYEVYTVDTSVLISPEMMTDFEVVYHFASDVIS